MRQITLMHLVLREVNICNNGLLARRPQRIHGPQRAIAMSIIYKKPRRSFIYANCRAQKKLMVELDKVHID